MTPYRFSLQKIFKKSTFFKFFCIFRISMTSWLEKWSYFWNLINFQFWPFCHFIDLQLLRPTEALSLSKKFHVSLLSHVVEVKYDCNVVIWPYFQSTPHYVQCACVVYWARIGKGQFLAILRSIKNWDFTTLGQIYVIFCVWITKFFAWTLPSALEEFSENFLVKELFYLPVRMQPSL